jgi:hypothetical protein
VESLTFENSPPVFGLSRHPERKLPESKDLARSSARKSTVLGSARGRPREVLHFVQDNGTLGRRRGVGAPLVLLKK